MNPNKTIIPPSFGIDPFFAVDPNGRIIGANQASAKIIGSYADNLSGGEFCKLFTSPENAQKMLGLILSGGTVDNFPLTFRSSKNPRGTDVLFNAFHSGSQSSETGNIFIIATVSESTTKALSDEALLASIVGSSDDAILSKSLDGTITSWNKGAEKIFGYSSAEIIGKNISILIPADLHAEETGIIEKIRAGLVIDHYETKRVKRDDILIDVSLTISPVKDAFENVIGASKIVRDITRQKKAEAATIEALKEKETVLNRISDGVVSIDTNWRYTFLNDIAMANRPYDKKETLGKLIWEVHPEIKGTIFWDKYQEAIETRKVQEVESFYAPMNAWFSVKIYPSADGLTIFYKDVTERKNTEQRLSASLKEVSDYKYALDESSIVAVTDQKGIITDANDNFCKISKYSREELIGQDHRIINSGYHPKSFIKELWTTIANGRIWKGELKNRAKDGTVYWVDTTIVPFLDDKGKPYQYVAIRADITERKRAEVELIEAQNDIVEFNRELEEKIIKRTEQLKESNKELENFSYSVSHDLRAPLRIIDGFGQILMEDHAPKLDNEGQEAINVIMRNARKMGQLIDDLLDFSKLGKAEMRISAVDMNKLVEEVLIDLQQGGIAIPAGLKVHKLKTAKGDNNLLKQVWVNLISNAIKYSGGREEPMIEIGMIEKGGGNIYYIKDNGAGFDMQYADKLFGVFQRLHKASEFSGTGVGLALAQRIIFRHGGKIWAEATLNEGATFYFTLDHQSLSQNLNTK